MQYLPRRTKLIAAPALRACAGALLIASGVLLSASQRAGGADVNEAIRILADTRIIRSADSTPRQIARALRDRGSCHLIQGHLDMALADLSAALDSKDLPGDDLIGTLADRASAYDQKGENAKAIADYTREIDLGADPMETALSGRAGCYQKSGKMDKAIADFGALVAMPNVPVATTVMGLRGRGDCYERLGQLDKAVAEYTRGIDLPQLDATNRATLLQTRAEAYLDVNDPDRAIADFTLAIDANAGDVAFSVEQRGACYANKGDIANALADDNRVIDMPEAPADDLSWALVSRAGIYIEALDLDKGLADLNKAIELKDLSADSMTGALYSRGNCYRKMGRIDKAIADYTTGMAVKDADPSMVAELQWSRGVCRGIGGDTKGADADYAQAIALCTKVIDSPDTVSDTLDTALVNRGFAEYVAGSLDKAMEDSRRALALRPRSSFAQYNIGTILLREGKFAEARKSYEAAMLLHTPIGTDGVVDDLTDLRDVFHGPAETTVFIGWIYVTHGRQQTGTKELKAYLKDHPAGPLADWAKELLATPASK